MRPVVPRSILVASDLGGASDAVVHAAGGLAAALDAELHVLHAFDFPALPYRERNPAAEPVTFADQLREAERELDAQLERTLPGGVRIGSREVVVFVAHRAIEERTAVVGADLVVIGPHREHPIADAFLGSTADHVVRTLDVPCLIARGDLHLPLRRILVPVDLSESARRALQVAIGWAIRLGGGSADTAAAGTAEVSAIHVVPPVYGGPEPLVDPARVDAQLADESAAALVGFDVPDGFAVAREIVCCDAPVPDEIVRVAEDDGSDLVVLATHGYGGLARALIGSVASAVARRAPCPVLLVPPRMWRDGAGATAG